MFKELNQRISWYAKKLEEVPKYILEIDENSLGDKQTIRDYEKLLNRYSTLIHQFQRAFNHFVKNDLLTSSERHKRETTKKEDREFSNQNYSHIYCGFAYRPGRLVPVLF